MGLRQVFPVHMNKTVRIHLSSIHGRGSADGSDLDDARVACAPSPEAGLLFRLFDFAILRYSRGDDPFEIGSLISEHCSRQAAQPRRETGEVEFVSYDEVLDLLEDYGIDRVPDGEERVYLRMNDAEGVVHMHLACPQSQAKPLQGAT